MLGYTPERSSTSRTLVAVHAPPRIVRMPRLVNSPSIRRKLMPAWRSNSAMTAANYKAKVGAAELRKGRRATRATRRPHSLDVPRGRNRSRAREV